MGKSLRDIAQELKESDKKVHLIYAFNGTGKTRLSKEFTKLVIADEGELTRQKILYYNAFTEDLFYWDNDLEGDRDFKLRIQDNSFINWIITDQGKDSDIISNFQQYTSDKLTPVFHLSEGFIDFTFARGNDDTPEKVKLSKGEESNFIWSIFYTLLESVVDELNVVEELDRGTTEFNYLEYVFIDDPVSSLDENHLIAVATHLGTLIRKSKSDLKFIITTHNPLFYNVLYNELKNIKRKEQVTKEATNALTGEIERYIEFVKVLDNARFRLEKLEDGTYNLLKQPDDSPFAYHNFLRLALHKAIKDNLVYKYHFNFLRNLYEKTSTFLGHQNWQDLLPRDNEGSFSNYESRIINISSHSKVSTEEDERVNPAETALLKNLLHHLETTCNYKEQP
ncbi:AAA family ATPase [Streptococcus suis]|uniref:Anticodon nuclease n=1 Tax=Streptococcus suis TaxID=1307 RepID=A0A116MUW0_STRSU|nr:AAA family ATPase [Streptococcus suis]NQF81480.1 AAA family ATPase [Streptococcus suis]NQO46719.1 AAA family ATPase [Streptococcus suis]WNF85248.1 AAA family ATPase [Streptococcus suis]CYV67370.1 anticodon nuclease [Streptococcus suis]